MRCPACQAEIGSDDKTCGDLRGEFCCVHELQEPEFRDRPLLQQLRRATGACCGARRTQGRYRVVRRHRRLDGTDWRRRSRACAGPPAAGDRADGQRRQPAAGHDHADHGRRPDGAVRGASRPGGSRCTRLPGCADDAGVIARARHRASDRHPLRRDHRRPHRRIHQGAERLRSGGALWRAASNTWRVRAISASPIPPTASYNRSSKPNRLGSRMFAASPALSKFSSSSVSGLRQQRFATPLLRLIAAVTESSTLLHQALGDAGKGRGRAIGICAPPGLGKSRLCFEFAKTERERQIPILEARASPYDHSGPLQPLIEFFRTYFRLAADDSAEVARQKIAARIEAVVPAMRDEVPLLVDFLGVAGSAPPLALDPPTKRARLLDFVRALVRDGVRTPTIIIIEDVHWLDEASNEVIAALIDVAPASRALIVVTYRPTLKAEWQAHPSFEEVRLSELSDDRHRGAGWRRAGRSSIDHRCRKPCDRAQRRKPLLRRRIDALAGR